MKSRDGARQIVGFVQSTAANTIWFANAIVTDVRMEDLRIRVEVLPDGQETNWLRLMFPLAGQNYGIYALPEVGTELGILFIGADPNMGVVVGQLFADDDTPDALTDATDLIIKPKEGGFIRIDKKGIHINSEHVFVGDDDGGGVLTTKTFLPKYNADMAAIAVHTNMICADPTLTTVGGANDSHACTKTKAS